MFDKFFEALYNKVYINILVGLSKTTVYVELCNKTGILNTATESFDTTSLNLKMRTFIEDAINESPFHYISVLDKSLGQGVIPTCSQKEAEKFYDLEYSKYICHRDNWIYYTSKIDLDTIKKEYSKIGTDFIFSPFSVLSNFFKDKIDGELALYALIEEGFISVAIFCNSKLLYGDHLDMQHSIEEDSIIIMDDDIELDNLEESIDLDEVDAMESLDDFGDIEDLDSIDEIDEFSEMEEQEEEIVEEEEEESVEDIEGFNEDYHRYLLLQGSINSFYKDSKYESEFIEQVYIADSVGMNNSFKTYLEEEMFLKVFIRHVELATEVCDLAKAEIR